MQNKSDIGIYGKADFEKYRESADFIRSKIGAPPNIGIILGSGLSGIVDEMEDKIVIPYRDIPNFPVSTVSYQKGELVYGSLGGNLVLAMNGRFHYYEGWEMWQTAYPVCVMKLLEINTLVITNAAGGISEKAETGSLVFITDHIKFAPDSPLRGENIGEFGVRFPDMQSVYDREYIDLAERIADDVGMPYQRGVYGYMSGPQYETPAEIRALKLLGADVVGMSTVAEVIAAAHCGLRVLCISCVSNKAAGITGEPLSEDEVVETGKRVSAGLERVVSKFIMTVNKKQVLCTEVKK